MAQHGRFGMQVRAKGAKGAAASKSAEDLAAEAKVHAARWARARGLTSECCALGRLAM